MSDDSDEVQLTWTSCAEDESKYPEIANTPTASDTTVKPLSHKYQAKGRLTILPPDQRLKYIKMLGAEPIYDSSLNMSLDVYADIGLIDQYPVRLLGSAQILRAKVDRIIRMRNCVKWLAKELKKQTNCAIHQHKTSVYVYLMANHPGVKLAWAKISFKRRKVQFQVQQNGKLWQAYGLSQRDTVRFSELLRLAAQTLEKFKIRRKPNGTLARGIKVNKAGHEDQKSGSR